MRWSMIFSTSLTFQNGLRWSDQSWRTESETWSCIVDEFKNWVRFRKLRENCEVSVHQPQGLPGLLCMRKRRTAVLLVERPQEAGRGGNSSIRHGWQMQSPAQQRVIHVLRTHRSGKDRQAILGVDGPSVIAEQLSHQAVQEQLQWSRNSKSTFKKFNGKTTST
jgi:hypothetical protein